MEANPSEKLTLAEILAIEPNLKIVADNTLLHRRRRFSGRIDAYERAKDVAWELVGWDAKDPRLRTSAAWDCFFDYILEGLRL